MFRFLTLLIIGLATLCGQVPAVADTAMQDAIRAEIGFLRQSGRLRDGTVLEYTGLVVQLYERRGFAPAWRAASRVAAARDAVRASHAHGLHPGDYGIAAIEEWSRWRAGFDVWLTDSVARLAFDVSRGKTRHDARDDVTLIESIVDAESVGDAITALAPQTRRYDGLRRQLGRYRELADAGGWATIPEGPSIEPNSGDPRIALLAKRLMATGDLAASDAGYLEFNDDLAAAVSRFQARHGLDADGLVGKKTLQTLNVPVAQRIDQIRINLERQRWTGRPDSGEHIVINVPAFNAYVYLDGQLAWTTRVIVGEPGDKTPLFHSELTAVIFNPTWSVPYSIASEEMLPKIRRDPNYLKRGNYRVVDRAGNEVDPASVDWSAIRRDTFPFTLVQQPGPGNELGRVKFLFPNPYSVCMHDTPGKSLFDRARRSFSHGCIRVDKPLQLAEVILSREGWTVDDIFARLQARKSSTVALHSPLPITLLYWTADVDDEGVLYFYDDLYGRDPAVLAALDSAPASERTVTE